MPPQSASVPLTEVLEHLMSMIDSLEQAWSGALKSDAAARARSATREAWSSFVQAFAQRAESLEAALEERGLHRLAFDLPPDDEEIASLDPDPTDAGQRVQQLDLAMLYSFESLLQAILGVEEPTGEHVTLGSHEVSTWWEAGAFALVRSRATALQSVLREMDHAYVELGVEQAPAPGSIPPRAAWEDLRDAAILVDQGWHEAATPKLLRALRLYVAEYQEMDPLRMGSLTNELKSNEDFKGLQLIAQKLEAACERIVAGLPCSQGFIVPVAEEAVRRIQALEELIAHRALRRATDDSQEAD